MSLSKLILTLSLTTLSFGAVAGQQVKNKIPGHWLKPILSKTETQSLYIIDGLDWQQVGSMSQTSHRRIQAYAVGNLTIPYGSGRSSRCTAFFVGKDLLMTNNHCVPRDALARNTYVVMGLEVGRPKGERATIKCPTLEATSPYYDFSILRCKGSPGDYWGSVKLAESRQVEKGSGIYVIHQNCLARRAQSCIPHKKYSPGKVFRIPAGKFRHISYSADTLVGSSGAPVFAGVSEEVVAINNIGLFHTNEDGEEIGDANAGIPMHLILDWLEENHPELRSELDYWLPRAAFEDLKAQRLEEETEDGPLYGVMDFPFDRYNALIHDSDIHHYSFELKEESILEFYLDLESERGDLDLELYRQNKAGFTLIHTSDGEGDIEQITKQLSLGHYQLRVVGYGGSTGLYRLEAQIL